MQKEHLYSEIFHSIQGEGYYTGFPTLWLRLWACNLQCHGFGQKDPTDPSTYKLPYADLDPSKYNRLEDFPVFEFGCDSSYSWSRKFKDKQHKGTPKQIYDRLIECMMKDGPNHHGLVKDNHMCFTGGEPMLRHNQEAIIDVMRQFMAECNVPPSITIETNGTQDLDFDAGFVTMVDDYVENCGGELFWSVSPKLFTVSGEKNEKAIKPEHVKNYYDLSKNGQLKFVVNGTKECWKEVEDVIRSFRAIGINFPTWIMPVSATKEGQEAVAGEIATQALKRGYKVSARVHCYLWGNVVGV
jgi:organic radical activating enzyme